MTKKMWGKLLILEVVRIHHPFISGSTAGVYVCNKNGAAFCLATYSNYGKTWGVTIGAGEEDYVKSQKEAIELIISSIDMKTIAGYMSL
jgi:hypothetical protein